MSAPGEIPQEHLQNLLGDQLFYRGLLDLARHARDLHCLGGVSIFHGDTNFADMRVHLPTTPEDNGGADPNRVLNFEPLLGTQKGAVTNTSTMTPLLVLNAESASEPIDGDVQLIPTKGLVNDFLDKLWLRNPNSILGYVALHNPGFESLEGNLLLGLMKAGPHFSMPDLLFDAQPTREGDELLMAMMLGDLRTVQIRYQPGEMPVPVNPERVAELYG